MVSSPGRRRVADPALALAREQALLSRRASVGPPLPAAVLTGGVLTDDVRAAAQVVAAHSIAGSTEVTRGVAKADGLWRRFSDASGWLHPSNDLFMLNDSDQVRLEKILSFYEWMRTHDTSVQRSHDGLRTVFQRALMVSGSVFASPALLQYVAGAAKAAVDSREVMLRRLANRTMALPLGWVEPMRALLFNWRPLDDAAIDLSLCYLVIMMQLHTMMRISNWAHTVADYDSRRSPPVVRDRDDKHVVRAGDVFLIINDRSLGIDLASRDRQRDRVVPSHLWDLSLPSHVIAMVFMLLTKKNTQFYPELKYVKRGNSVAETRLLTDLLLSRSLAPADPERPFFSRVGKGGEVRRTRGGDVSAAGKLVAKSHGYDPHNFSTTSNRISGISSLAKMGLTPEAIQTQSGHKSSRAVSAHYTQAPSRLSAPRESPPPQSVSVLAFSPNSGWDDDDLDEQVMAMAFARTRLAFPSVKFRTRG